MAWSLLAYGLRRLGTDDLDTYRPARLDPAGYPDARLAHLDRERPD